MYHTIISQENLLVAWGEFIKGKKHKRDVEIFHYHLIDHIQFLHEELQCKQYAHGGYHAFNISDPKPRNIHKASVRDRLVHHAIYRILYPHFDRFFVSDSYSCRLGKGTHKAIEKFTQYARQASENDTKTVWVLKCDIRKCFASIDHEILLAMLAEHVHGDVMWLLERVVRSFSSLTPHKGLPLGNLTSQLFVNIYMNEFDQFLKHELKAHYYIRYADDFVVFSQDKEWLHGVLEKMERFLWGKLRLTMHPNKVSLTTLASGADFLGWVHFPDHRVLRTTTKRRMLKRIAGRPTDNMVQSYLGLLHHGNTHRLQEVVIK